MRAHPHVKRPSVVIVDEPVKSVTAQSRPSWQRDSKQAPTTAGRPRARDIVCHYVKVPAYTRVFARVRSRTLAPPRGPRRQGKTERRKDRETKERERKRRLHHDELIPAAAAEPVQAACPQGPSVCNVKISSKFMGKIRHHVRTYVNMRKHSTPTSLALGSALAPRVPSLSPTSPRKLWPPSVFN